MALASRVRAPEGRHAGKLVQGGWKRRRRDHEGHVRLGWRHGTWRRQVAPPREECGNAGRRASALVSAALRRWNRTTFARAGVPWAVVQPAVSVHHRGALARRNAGPVALHLDHGPSAQARREARIAAARSVVEEVGHRLTQRRRVAAQADPRAAISHGKRTHGAIGARSSEHQRDAAHRGVAGMVAAGVRGFMVRRDVPPPARTEI